MCSSQPSSLPLSSPASAVSAVVGFLVAKVAGGIDVTDGNVKAVKKQQQQEFTGAVLNNRSGIMSMFPVHMANQWQAVFCKNYIAVTETAFIHFTQREWLATLWDCFSSSADSSWDYGLLTLMAYNSTAIPPRPTVTIER